LATISNYSQLFILSPTSPNSVGCFSDPMPKACSFDFTMPS
jgi:hypothetical protein